MDAISQVFPLFSYFLVGLGLNLTPCVYPMITVTVSIFGTSHSPEKSRDSFWKAFSYFLGIVVMYSALGLFVSLTGTFFGAFLQNRWVLLCVAVFIFLLSLSMFGHYQIRLPTWLLVRLGKFRGGSYAGLFLSGLLVGVFAAPCIGPPIAALLSIAVANPTHEVFWSFFALSIGLGLPYLILGTFAGLIHKLPKSGQWLIWFDRLFAVVLLGLSGYYLALALNPGFIKWVVPLTLIGGGFYLGFLVSEGLLNSTLIRIKWFAGTAAIVLGISLISTSPKAGGVVWDAYTPSRVQQSVMDSKPVIIDFYADWCITCHELEQMVFSQDSIKAALDGFTRLRVDATYSDDPTIGKILEQYDVFGLPTVVMLDPSGREIKDARVIGYLSAEDFLEKVKLVTSPSG